MNFLLVFSKALRVFLAGILFLIIIVMTVLVLIKTTTYLQPDFSKGFLLDKKQLFNGIYKYGFWLHIVSGPLIALLGTFLFFFRKVSLKKRWHKPLGNAYVWLILGLSAPGGFIMSFYALGGWSSTICFALLAILWFWSTLFAYRMIKSGKVFAHRNYITISYFLTLSAIHLRLLSYLFAKFFHWRGPDAYAVIAWLSWVPLLGLALLINWYVAKRSEAIG